MQHLKPVQETEVLDLSEKGMPKNGVPQSLNRRLYIQLQVFTGCKDSHRVAQRIKNSGLQSVLYQSMNDPYGLGVLCLSENASDFTDSIKAVYTSQEFQTMKMKSKLTMLGRTYASGHEQDLEEWLIKKPCRTALNPEWPWAIWYPLRRKPEFAVLPPEDQKRILMEHAVLGRRYGSSELAHDIRLACYGLDQNDNEFVIGIVGSDLYPLSRLIQDMRKTEQTSRYIQSLGPFFIGKAIWQSPFEP